MPSHEPDPMSASVDARLLARDRRHADRRLYAFLVLLLVPLAAMGFALDSGRREAAERRDVIERVVRTEAAADELRSLGALPAEVNGLEARIQVAEHGLATLGTEQERVVREIVAVAAYAPVVSAADDSLGLVLDGLASDVAALREEHRIARAESREREEALATLVAEAAGESRSVTATLVARLDSLQTANADLEARLAALLAKPQRSGPSYWLAAGIGAAVGAVVGVAAR